MKLALPFLLFASLAACGADGAPEAPASMDETPAGLSISGCVKAGVTVGPKAVGPTRC